MKAIKILSFSAALFCLSNLYGYNQYYEIPPAHPVYIDNQDLLYKENTSNEREKENADYQQKLSPAHPMYQDDSDIQYQENVFKRKGR